ncbi:hypothetical protein QBC42DRAFT_350264 [Cladorrhinum samala]|uniref:Uncharacterized protein n=1 Tax=Cladorrhinum samala TaxID=585594 RepID=A0AAV9H9H2_9PEZI|nr:hypothetical protein QBC42DRAFT_350264 [Cladorrhinum samala]
MQNLTSSDISFLLCTILSASSPFKQPATSGFLPPLRLTLKTSYGLQIKLSPSRPSDLSISLGGTNKPSPPAALKPISKQTRPPPLEPLLPLFHPAPLPSPPSSPPAYQPPPRPSRGILHLSPCFRTSTFLWHSSGSFSSRSTESITPKPINESLLEPHYGPAFYSAYLDWVDRAEALENINFHFNHCPESFYARSCGGGRATEPESGVTAEMRDSPDDELQEGERILWMVEGVLLAAWLALQGDVEAVEYAPWDRRGARLCDDGTTRGKNGKAEQGYPYYWLDKGSAGEVVKALLRDVGV